MKVADLSPSDLRHRLAGAGLSLRTGPCVVNLRSRLPHVAAGLRLLYADFPIHDDGFADYHVALTRPRGLRRFVRPQVWFRFDDRTPFKPLPLDQALPMFEWCLNWCIGAHAHDCLIIHAAVIERNGFAVILPGAPGSGKSTLTAALIHRGWRLLTDELCMIGLDDGLVRPIARPVSLKNQSIDILRAFAPQAVIGPMAHDTVKGTVAHVKPPAESVRRMDDPATPRWVVFPKWEKDAPPTLTPRDKAPTLLRMGEHAFNYSLLGLAGFKAMTRLMDACTVRDFRYGKLDDAVQVFEELASAPSPLRGEGGTPQAGRVRGRADDEAGCPSVTEPATTPTPSPSPRPSPPRNGRGGIVSRDLNLRDLLPRAIREPASVLALDLPAWDLLIRHARQARVLPRLGIVIDDAGLLDRVPTAPRRHLLAARAHSGKHERSIRWEARCLERELAPLDGPIVLMKGAAYVVAGLPAGRGRLASDVDIMVPRDRLADAERTLNMAGWLPTKSDPYDQRYYRQWMHELPPMQHHSRMTTLDVHHNILPLTSRVVPDPRKLAGELWTGIVPVPGHPRLFTLGPEDMVLHSAAHLFCDGEFEHGLRDLVDLDALLRHFADTRPGFWDSLTARARRLSLTRPLHYAVRYAARFLHTPVPEPAMRAVDRFGPPEPFSTWLDEMFDRALAADHATTADRFTGVAKWLLFVRAHYLRMPLRVLLPHLVRKSFRKNVD